MTVVVAVAAAAAAAFVKPTTTTIQRTNIMSQRPLLIAASTKIMMPSRVPSVLFTFLHSNSNSSTLGRVTYSIVRRTASSMMGFDPHQQQQQQQQHPLKQRQQQQRVDGRWQKLLLTTTATSLTTTISSAGIETVQYQRSQQQQQQEQLCQYRRRSFHSSCFRTHLVHKDAIAAQPTEEELKETDDTIPVWRNPLHHNNVELTKMYPEDFDDGEDVMVPIPLPPLETDPNKVVAPPHIHQLAHEIVHLNLLELRELTDRIATHYGFDDSMMAASYGGGGGAATGAAAAAGSDAPVVEEVPAKTVFDLKLVGFDAKAKIKVIKEIRAIAGLGLKEAKELVESAPKVFQKGLKQEKAEELKAVLESAGAEVEIV